MTFEEVMAQQPMWLVWWLNWLFFGAFVLPVALLIWKRTRVTAVVTVVASVLGGIGVTTMYGQMGYVKLLGLPHVIIWTPLAIYLWKQAQADDMPVWAGRIIWVVLATILVSLAFDYVDVARYVLGERTPTVLPPGMEQG